MNKKDNKPYDTAFTLLTDRDPEALLRLIDALPAGAIVQKMPREYSAPALAPDQPYQIIGENLRYIVHFEAQTRWDSSMPNRILEYDVRLWLNSKLPIQTYVIGFIQEGFPEDTSTNYTVYAKELTLSSQFSIIRLWELSADRALAENSEFFASIHSFNER